MIKLFCYQSVNKRVFKNNMEIVFFLLLAINVFIIVDFFCFLLIASSYVESCHINICTD